MKLTGEQFSVKTTDTPAVTDLIHRTTKLYGFNVQEGRTVEDEIQFSAMRTGPWYGFLVSSRLQRVDWTFQYDEKTQTTVLTYDRRWFDWYRLAVIAAAVPVACLWCYGLHTLLNFADVATEFTWIPAALPWVGIFAMFVFQHRILSYSDSLAYIDRIRTDLRAKRLRLDALPDVRWNRGTVFSITFLVYAIIPFIIIILGESFPQIRLEANLENAFPCAILLLVFLVLALFIAMYVISVRFGAGERFLSVKPALSGLAVVLLLTTGQFSLRVFGLLPAENWNIAMHLRSVYRETGSRNGPRSIASYREEKAARDLEELLPRFWAFLFLPLALLLLALGFGIISIRSAAETQRMCFRLQIEACSVSTRACTAGRGFLRIFQSVLVVVWVVIVALATFGLVELLRVASRAIVSPFAVMAPSDPVGTVCGTSNAIVLLLELEHVEETVQLSVRILFVVWAFALPFLACVSVLDLVCRHLRTRKRLAHGISVDGTQPDGNEKFSWLADLQHRAGSPALSLLLTESKRPLAQVHVGQSQVRLVEISCGAVDLLSSDELGALVAHEFAHHVCGHPRKHNTLQWLGRLTLVGDTFVGTLEDSFGYELKADRIAVTRFGVSPDSLRNALLKMQVATLVGSKAKAPGRDRQTSKSTRGRIWSAVVGPLSFWLALYRGDPPLSYWHPSLRERLEALDRLEEWPEDSQSNGICSHAAN